MFIHSIVYFCHGKWQWIRTQAEGKRQKKKAVPSEKWCRRRSICKCFPIHSVDDVGRYDNRYFAGTPVGAHIAHTRADRNVLCLMHFGVNCQDYYYHVMLFIFRALALRLTTE